MYFFLYQYEMGSAQEAHGLTRVKVQVGRGAKTGGFFTWHVDIYEYKTMLLSKAKKKN